MAWDREVCRRSKRGRASKLVDQRHEPELAAITGLRLDKVVAPDKGFGAGRLFGRVDPAERHNHDTGRTASACPLAGPFLLAARQCNERGRQLRRGSGEGHRTPDTQTSLCRWGLRSSPGPRLGSNFVIGVVRRLDAESGFLASSDRRNATLSPEPPNRRVRTRRCISVDFRRPSSGPFPIEIDGVSSS